MFRVFLPLMLMIVISSYSKAENIYIVIQKQQEQKKQSRWSLGEWMIQERQIRLMDQWLAANTKEIGSEWKLFYNQGKYTRDSGTTTDSDNEYGLNIFYGFLGVATNQIKDDSNLYKSHTVNIKLLGSSQQSTHLNLGYGVGSKDSYSDAKSFMANGDLYLLANIGLSFYYGEIEGNDKTHLNYFKWIQRETGIFLESGFIRINWRSFIRDIGTSSSSNKDKGTKLGLEFNF